MNKYLTALIVIVLTSCGRPVKQIQHPISQPVFDRLSEKLNTLPPRLLTCDGGPTDSLGNTITGREICDTGDSIAPVGLISTIYNVPSFEQYLRDSIGSDGRPYRSPEHKRFCENSPNQDSEVGCNFSRDHLFGHMLYAVATKNPEFLLKIQKYMNKHSQKFCVGDIAQCGMTPAAWDVLGDTYDYLGLDKPIYSYIPDTVTVPSELITVMTNSEFQLSLVADVIYIKLLTGKLNSNYYWIINKLVDKAPYNTYFKYLQYKSGAYTCQDAFTDNLAEELLGYINTWENQETQQSVWYWSWDEIDHANAWSFIFMGNLLLKESKGE